MSSAFGVGGTARRAGAVVQDGAAPPPPSDEEIFEQRMNAVYGTEEEERDVEAAVVILQEPWRTAAVVGLIGSVVILGMATTDVRPTIVRTWKFFEKLWTPSQVPSTTAST
jgi:hypothetical protein